MQEDGKDLCNWRKKFIPNYSNLIEPFAKLLRKGNKIAWNNLEKSFNQLKVVLTNTQTLS